MRYKLSILGVLSFLLVLGACSTIKHTPLSGDDLRRKLYNKINDNKVLGYQDLWVYFPMTDTLKDSKDIVWDIYSYKEGRLPYHFIFKQDQCGNYKQEGDCYNREHSFPQQWWGAGDPPQRADLFHIYPTDGKVNSIRSNFPYGEVREDAVSITTENGSKLGQSKLACYIGTVFEPLDEFKGDLARGYFYMMTRYMPEIASWDSPILDGDNLSACFRELLLRWSKEDPVSDKERARNKVIQTLQNNYNPFIEDPSLIERVWN